MQSLLTDRTPLDGLAHLKDFVPVFRHIPRGAHNQAAGGLCNVNELCLANNGIDEWSKLLYFAYMALRVLAKE